MNEKRNPTGAYETGAYWRRRRHYMYYQYFRYMVYCLGHDAQRIIDVGSGNSPYLEWFDWIPNRVSVDIRMPYSSDTVHGIQGDIHTLNFEEKFDLCTCMQVLEHIPDPAPFAARLLELGNLVLVSVPFKWANGSTKGHVNDPVDLQSLVNWFGRKPNYHLVVKEPFATKKHSRLFAVFDPERPDRKFGNKTRRNWSA